MLYKNGSPYEMTEKEKQALRETFTFPVYLRYPPHFIKPSKLNPLPDKPAGINIPLKSIIREDGTTVEWRWAQSTTLGQNGRTVFSPRVIPFQGDWSVRDLDLDLLYFLYYKSPYCMNGELDQRQKKKAYFEIEDLAQAATHKINTRRLEGRVRTLIDDDDLGLSERKLRAVAKAYFVPNADMLTLNQLRVVLDLEVRKDRKTGFQKFLNMVNADEMIKNRGLIRTAADEGVVRWDLKTKTWHFAHEDGGTKKGDPICKVNKIEPMAGLVEFYNGNDDFKQRLDAEMDGIYSTEVVSKVIDDGSEVKKA